jgi:hypothetical protein
VESSALDTRTDSWKIRKKKNSQFLSSKLETVIRSGSGGKSMKEHHIELTRKKGSPIRDDRLRNIMSNDLKSKNIST